MTNFEIKIGSIESFAEGREFGEAGPYLRIRGTARGELDPAAPQNQVIVDLDKAPRNARGSPAASPRKRPALRESARFSPRRRRTPCPG